MPKKHHLRQPTATKHTTAEPPVFHLQELPDPDSCLTEEQKKWPQCSTWRPFDPQTDAPQPPQPQPPPTAPAE